MVRRRLLDLNTASIPVDLSKDLSPLRAAHDASFDPNLIVILAALLCALVCALAINYIIRWAFHCGHLISGRRRRPAEEEEGDGSVSPAAPPHSKGLKRAAVQTLPTITYAKPPDAELDCPICLADFADGEKVRVLPKCNHSFHRQCIDKWLLHHSSCPTCRQNLVDVLSEKKTVAALLCRYQHSHAYVDTSSIRIIIHQAADCPPQHSIPAAPTQPEESNPDQGSRASVPVPRHHA